MPMEIQDTASIVYCCQLHCKYDECIVDPGSSCQSCGDILKPHAQSMYEGFELLAGDHVSRIGDPVYGHT